MDGNSHESDDVREIILIVFFGIVVCHLLLLASLICRHVCTSLEPSDHAGGQPAPAAVDAVERPLACTYLRADGWRDDAACGVCLEDLADGDEVTLLQPCMHCFHAACARRWIQLRATCPLCRAPVADAGGVASRVVV